MAIRGKKTKIERWIHSARCAVRVEVDAVFPDFDSTEPCLEPKTLRFLDELQEKVNRGLLSELAKVGEVYVRQSA